MQKMLGEPLKTVILGYGKMGKIRAAAMAENPAYCLVAAFDPNPTQLDGLPSSVRRLTSESEVASLQADAAIVCATNDAISRLAVQCLKKGMHVFCEKPPGRSFEEAKAIADAHRDNPGTSLMFGFNHRQHDAVIEAKKIVESGMLGKLLWSRGVYGKAGGGGFEQNWRNERSVSGGGILLDQGIHLLDLILLFFGDFEEVHSFVGTHFWNINVEDNAFVMMRNLFGQSVMFHSSATQWKHQFNLELFLSEGYVKIDGILSSTRSYGRETLIVARRPANVEGYSTPREQVMYFDEEHSWQREMDEFADYVLRRRPEPAFGSWKDAVRVMDHVERIYRADSKWQANL